MRIRTLFTLVLALFMSSVACTSKAPEQKPETKTVAPINTPQPQSKDALDIAASQAEIKASAMKEIKANAVKGFNEAFQKHNDWTAALRGSTDDKVCELRNEFYRINGVMGYFQGRYTTVLEWSDVAIEEGAARKRHIATALEYAKSLNSLLSKPHSQRLLMGSCGSGEGSLGFSEGNNLMNELEIALKAVGRMPEDIGTSTEQLRTALLDDYKARIAKAREELVKVKASADELDLAQTIFARLVWEAEREWNFSQQQLGITAEEQKFVEDNIRG